MFPTGSNVGPSNKFVFVQLSAKLKAVAGCDLVSHDRLFSEAILGV
jgi:hypothetical protein